MSAHTTRWLRGLVGTVAAMATALSLCRSAIAPVAAASGPFVPAARHAQVHRAVPPGQKAAHFAPPALARGRVARPLTSPIRAVPEARMKPGAAVFQADVRPAKGSAPRTGPPAAARPADGAGNACDSAIAMPDSSTDLDGYLEQAVSVGFASDVSCVDVVDFAAEALLIDRSPDFNGQSFDGDDISDGGLIEENGTSTGDFEGDTRTYDGARSVESAVALDAILTDGSVWGGCAAGPGVEIQICDRIGTDEPFSVYGTGGKQTGMAPACRFTPYLSPGGGQRVDIVNTVSDGGDPALFKLEFHNGRNRSTGTGFGDGANGPHVASIAVAGGGGGGFLSNEIAYRVSEVRDELDSPVLVGHIHTPRRTNVDTSVAQSYESLLASAVQAVPPVRVTAITDKALYRVGDAPVYTVKGPPNAEALWSSSLDGIETGEIDVDYGQGTDGDGALTVVGGVWTSADIGTWIKTGPLRQRHRDGHLHRPESTAIDQRPLSSDREGVYRCSFGSWGRLRSVRTMAGWSPSAHPCSASCCRGCCCTPTDRWIRTCWSRHSGRTVRHARRGRCCAPTRRPCG